MHQNSNISSSTNRMHKSTNLKNYKFNSFNNGNNLDNYSCRPLDNSNELYGLPITPYSLQNLLLLDSGHHQLNDQSAQFNQNNGNISDIPTPPLPPNIVQQTTNSKPTLIKQRSLAAIDLDQYTDAHFQHHLQTLAHQFNQQLQNRHLTNIHRTMSNEKCNLLNPVSETTFRNPEVSQTDDLLLYTSQDYSPDLDLQYTNEDNQTND